MTDELLDALEGWVWSFVAVAFHLAVIHGSVWWISLRFGEYGVRAHTFGFHPLRDVALGVAVGAALALAWVGFAAVSPAGRRMAEVLAGAGAPPPQGRLWTTSVAAVGEELLFRAVLQATWGAVPGVILFAAAHVPWRRELWPWPLTGLVSGAALAGLYLATDAVLAGATAQVLLGLTSQSRWSLRAFGGRDSAT